MCSAVPTEKQYVLTLGIAGCICRQILFWTAVIQRKILGSVCLNMNPFSIFSILFKQDCLYLFSKIIFWKTDNQYEKIDW